MPQLTGDVVFTDQIDIVQGSAIGGGGFRLRLTGTDHIAHHGLARDTVTQVLSAIKTRRIYGYHRHPPARFCSAAHRADIITNEGRDAGVIDEDRRRAVVGNGLFDAME